MDGKLSCPELQEQAAEPTLRTRSALQHTNQMVSSNERRSQEHRAQDRSRINTHEDYEVRYWSKKFGVSADQLKAAVKKVGNSAAAVEKELAK